MSASPRPLISVIALDDVEEADDEDEEDEEDEDVDEEKEVPGTLETVAGDELEPSSSRTKWTVLT